MGSGGLTSAWQQIFHRCSQSRQASKSAEPSANLLEVCSCPVPKHGKLSNVTAATGRLLGTDRWLLTTLSEKMDRTADLMFGLNHNNPFCGDNSNHWTHVWSVKIVLPQSAADITGTSGLEIEFGPAFSPAIFPSVRNH